MKTHRSTGLYIACGIASHMASEHLMLMRRCGLLKSEQRGRRVYYRVAEEHLSDILRCIENRFDAHHEHSRREDRVTTPLETGNPGHIF